MPTQMLLETHNKHLRMELVLKKGMELLLGKVLKYEIGD